MNKKKVVSTAITKKLFWNVEDEKFKERTEFLNLILQEVGSFPVIIQKLVDARDMSLSACVVEAVALQHQEFINHWIKLLTADNFFEFRINMYKTYSWHELGVIIGICRIAIWHDTDDQDFHGIFITFLKNVIICQKEYANECGGNYKKKKEFQDALNECVFDYIRGSSFNSRKIERQPDDIIHTVVACIGAEPVSVDLIEIGRYLIKQFFYAVIGVLPAQEMLCILHAWQTIRFDSNKSTPDIQLHHYCKQYAQQEVTQVGS